MCVRFILSTLTPSESVGGLGIRLSFWYSFGCLSLSFIYVSESHNITTNKKAPEEAIWAKGVLFTSAVSHCVKYNNFEN